MTQFDEIDQLLKEADAFIAGGQPEQMVNAAEATLGFSFPHTFREYLLRWGNLSFDGIEYYGLTRNDDFENARVPNCVWYTLQKRAQIGLPEQFLVFQNINDAEFVCLDLGRKSDAAECSVVVWDNEELCISQRLDVTFIDYLREELKEYIHER